MKKLLSLIILFSGGMIAFDAQADLLERMNLEDGFRERIREVVKVFDPQAQIMTQFSYRSFQGTLPGTTLTYDAKTIPSNIEDQDMASVDINIYSSKNDFPPEMEKLVRNSLPIDSRKIHVKFHEMKVIPEANHILQTHLIEKTAQQVIQALSQTLGWALGATVLFLTVCFGFIGWRRQQQFSAAINRVVSSLNELQTPQMPVGPASRAVDHEPTRALTSSGTSPLEGYKMDSIKSMISDCYWTNKDSYAVWVWRSLDFNQRTEVLESLPFMKAYSMYLSDLSEKQFPFFDHSYYLRPQNLLMTSQEDLAQVVQAYPSTWHKLSPLRQAELPITLEEKLKCMNVSMKESDQTNSFPQSSLRTLFIKGSWGELKDEDEMKLLKNPEIVPKDVRGQIKSLVWLTLLPEEHIREKFEKLDARSLATAWVGPEDMLARLEGYLPEKKRELLKGYKTRIPANRDSSAFLWLWEESLKDEAL